MPFESVHNIGSNNYGMEAEKIRLNFADYFLHDGAIPWQWGKAQVSEYSSVKEMKAMQKMNSLTTMTKRTVM